jgi:xanthine/CO dehydrogenase XdhC/CoxF family maturation factor
MGRQLTALHDALCRGEDTLLCTIIASSGSMPRGSGAKTAMFAGGSSVGTVGGGALEFGSSKLAKQTLPLREPFTQCFNLAKNQTADIDTICGGQVTVDFQCFAGKDTALIKIPEAALLRVHTPIGLSIGAEAPAEIAISIAAELIARRAGLTREV